MACKMERFLSLFLTLLIWRGSSGFAVWNQKPANYWQGAGPVPQTVQGSGTWTQVPPPQTGGSVSASPVQQQSIGQSAGSNWFSSSGLWVHPASQGQAFNPVPRTVPRSGTLTQVSQSSPQVGASVSAFPAQQQSVGQPAGGSNWFGSSGQWVHPASQDQTFSPVPHTVPSSGTWTQVSQSLPQVEASVSAFPVQQQSYDQAASWVPSQVQGVSRNQGQSSTAVQAQLTRPVLATGNVANLYSTAQGAYGLQSSDVPSWRTQPQRPSPVATQFQPSQNVGQVLQGATTSGSSKWLKVVPPELNPSWSSVAPPALVPSTNNIYASLSQVAAPSADARFQSARLGSAFQTSGFSTNSATGSPSFSHTPSVPTSVFSSQTLPSGVLPSSNLGVSTQGPLTWQFTGYSQSVHQGSASVGPAVQSNPLSSNPSRVSTFLPGATSSFSLVPGPNSQASFPYAQIPAVRVPSNQLNFNTVGTSSGAPVGPGSSSSVKG